MNHSLTHSLSHCQATMILGQEPCIKPSQPKQPGRSHASNPANQSSHNKQPSSGNMAAGPRKRKPQHKPSCWGSRARSSRWQTKDCKPSSLGSSSTSSSLSTRPSKWHTQECRPSRCQTKGCRSSSPSTSSSNLSTRMWQGHATLLCASAGCFHAPCLVKMPWVMPCPFLSVKCLGWYHAPGLVPCAGSSEKKTRQKASKKPCGASVGEHSPELLLDWWWALWTFVQSQWVIGYHWCKDVWLFLEARNVFAIVFHQGWSELRKSLSLGICLFGGRAHCDICLVDSLPGAGWIRGQRP